MDGLDKEGALLDARREKLGPGPAVPPDRRNKYRALAFSGGGIRSATFSLGVLEAIAKDRNPAANLAGQLPCRRFPASRLSTFDYLSTVSGGGYLGGFLCSLFKPGRLRTDTPDQTEALAADDAIKVLTSGPPGRIHADGPFDGDHIYKAPMAWLRENGRYLMPTGVGDAFYAAALGVRNWLALHYVIGTVLIMLLAMVGWVRAFAYQHAPWVKTWDDQALYLVAHAAATTERIWWSPLFPLAVVPVVLLGIPIGIAFWLVNERQDGNSWPFNLAVLGCVGVSAVLVGAGLEQAGQVSTVVGAVKTVGVIMAGLGLVWAIVRPWKKWAGWARTGDGPNRPSRWRQAGAAMLIALLDASLAWVAYTVLRDSLVGHAPAEGWVDYLVLKHPAIAGGLEVMAAIVIYFALGLATLSATVQRVLLTRWLAWVLVGTAGIAGLAIVDTLGQTLYFLATHGEPSKAPVLAPAGLVTALVWLSRHFAAKGAAEGLPAWLKNLPALTLAGLAGILIFTLVGALWSLFVHWLVWGGVTPSLDGAFQSPAQMATQLQIVGVGLFLSVVTGLFPGFINLSSLQAFYSSRLTRAYLGASNGERFKPNGPGLSAAEPLPNDNLSMAHYYGPPPGHPGGPSSLKTLAPLHIINITVNKTVDPAEQLVQRDRKGQPMAVLPLGFSIDQTWRDGFPNFKISNEVKRHLFVGQWIGTSGAAFSTGIGRETSLGMSLLMGAANVRLGTWWESGLGITQQRGIADFLRRSVGVMFRTQSYISYELRARFFGTHRRWQYLSDGGHFENTGIYELLRPERRVYQVFACDNGADPHYRFEDLANLIRLARIDLGVNLQVEDAFADPILARVFANQDGFQRMGKPPTANEPRGTPCALLLWAYRIGEDAPCTQIVLIKPNVPWNASADVRQYAVDHASFPQEPTADQFFDEAQWESYRSLGYQLGRKVFHPEVMAALDDLARAKIPARPAP